MLAFVHIPKTAGTTLHKIIAHQHHPGKVWIHHDTDGELTPGMIAEIRRRKVQVIMGHFSVGIHRQLPEVRYITCLRDPMARLVSHYRHALNDPAHYLHDAVVSQKLDLAGYVASGLSGELSNGMTRMLAGLEDFHGGTVDDEVFETAKRHLDERTDAVILSEHFDEGVISLSRRLSWSAPYYLRRKVGRHVPVPGPPIRDQWQQVAEFNRYDQELYNWAKERCQLLFPSEKSLTAFRKANAGRGKLWFCLRELRLRTIRVVSGQREGRSSEFKSRGGVS